MTEISFSASCPGLQTRLGPSASRLKHSHAALALAPCVVGPPACSLSVPKFHRWQLFEVAAELWNVTVGKRTDQPDVPERPLGPQELINHPCSESAGDAPAHESCRAGTAVIHRGKSASAGGEKTLAWTDPQQAAPSGARGSSCTSPSAAKGSPPVPKGESPIPK